MTEENINVVPERMERDIEIQREVTIMGGTTPTGTKQITIDSAGTTTENVSSFANIEITVPQGSASTPFLETFTATPNISISGRTITASVNAGKVITPIVNEGWVSSGNGNRVTASGSNTAQIPSEFIVPTGSQTITQNGTVDVTSLAEVVVNVSGGGDQLPNFLNNTLTELVDDNGDVTSVVDYGCRSRTALTKVRLIGCTSIGDYAFYGCSNADTIVLPSLASNLDAREFQGCSNLTKLDIKGYKIGFSGSSNPPWLNDAKLDTIILRKSDSIVTLSPVSGVAYTFNGTPFASNGSGGTLYVPSALVNSYKNGTNWTTWFADNGNHNNQVKAIEGSQYENYYADGTPIT